MGSKIRPLRIQDVRYGVAFCRQHAQIVGQAFTFAMLCLQRQEETWRS